MACVKQRTLFATALAVAVSNIVLAAAQVTNPAANHCPFSQSVQFTAPQNEHFTPIELPAGSKVHGIVLSGHAQMSQTDGKGSVMWNGKSVSWDEPPDKKLRSENRAATAELMSVSQTYHMWTVEYRQ